MLDALIAWDQNTLMALNRCGDIAYDPLWLFITKQWHWTPLYVLMAYGVFKQFGLKSFLYVLLFVAFMLLLTDQLTNGVKFLVMRSRPCNTPGVMEHIRIVKCSDTYSFFSGHAANSMAVVMFLFQLMRRHRKGFAWFFIFPLIFAYSRIYLGLHYPLDILCGFVFGGCCGYLMSLAFQRFAQKQLQ